MKYKITIEEIKDKEVIKSVYFSAKKTDSANGDYRDVQTTEETEEKIYEQTVEADNFDIKKVIDAFNEKPQAEAQK